MNKNRRYLWYILQQYMKRYFHPTAGDNRFLIAFGMMAGCCMLFLFATLVTGMAIFARLMYGTLVGIIVVAGAGIRWRLWDNVKQMKGIDLEASTATRSPALITPSNVSGEEKLHTVAKAFRWQYILATLSFIIAVYLPDGRLKIGFLCLMSISFLWAIQRIWSYRPASEGGKQARFTTLKLGYSLASAGFILLGTFIIIFQIIGIDTMATFTSPTLYVWLIGVCGFLICTVGGILALYLLRDEALSSLFHNERHL